MSFISPTQNILRAANLFSKNQHSEETKTQNFAKKIFSSPTLWILLLTLSVGIFSPIAAHFLMPTSTIIIIDTFALMTILDIALQYKKIISYEISFLHLLIKNKLKSSWNWYNKIDENIILGAMPLKNKNHLEELISLAGKKEKLSILSILEKWEVQRQTPFTTPITPNDWKVNNVNQLIIEGEDHIPPTLEQLKDGVDFINTEIAKGKKVYVHCKAGRGRSAITLACYYMLKNKRTPRQAIEFIESKRPIVTLYKKPKLERMKEFYEKFVK